MIATSHESALRGGKRVAPRSRPFLSLALSFLVILLVVVISPFWHLSTRVQLELATTRLAFTPGGGERREILNRSVPFSSLVVEDCSAVIFAAEKLEIADPRHLVPGTLAGEIPRFPIAAWREIPHTNPVRLSCSDPAAKVELIDADQSVGRIGILDRIHFSPGLQVVLEIFPGKEPSLSVEVETHQDLNIFLAHDFELVADFAKPEGIAVPFPDNLLTYRVRLPEARRMLKITSGNHGLVLIVTPPRAELTEFFREPLDLPLSSVELLKEDLEGTLTSPLRDKARLNYPAFPNLPPVAIDTDEAVSLCEFSQARLSSLELDGEMGVLRARIDGIATLASSRSGAFSRDHRLTLFHILRYQWLWALAVATAWLITTSVVHAIWESSRSSLLALKKAAREPLEGLSVTRTPRIPKGKFDVFLSHANGDKLVVEDLARRLSRAGLEPYLYEWHLVPGEAWQEALEKALDRSRTFAILVGPSNLGPWQTEEMRIALAKSIGGRGKRRRVIPVLLPGASTPEKKALSPFLKQLTWVDFRDGLDDLQAFHRLVCGIKGITPGDGPPEAEPSSLSED